MNTPNTENGVGSDAWLASLSNALWTAQDRYRAALNRRWPEGTIVHVYLSAVQKCPSRAEVISHHGDGTLAVRLFTVNRRGNRTVKHVHWERVANPQPEPPAKTKD